VREQQGGRLQTGGGGEGRARRQRGHSLCLLGRLSSPSCHRGACAPPGHALTGVRPGLRRKPCCAGNRGLPNGVWTFDRAAAPRRETATSPPAPSSQCNVFTRSESQGQGPSHGQLSHATKAGRVEKRVVCCVVGGPTNDEDRHVVPELSQPLVWVCDMRHVTGQWTGECEMCNDSHDVMWVSESILCGSINRWRMRAVCHSPAVRTAIDRGELSSCLPARGGWA